jgi:hypothetical protein
MNVEAAEVNSDTLVSVQSEHVGLITSAGREEFLEKINQKGIRGKYPSSLRFE